ncbi:alpha-1,2-mannosyltransferase [Pisolithus croceorrhizus]|nr:alpha-1,2-mannosyltransferase [Pisolithus croceorrhizus]
MGVTTRLQSSVKGIPNRYIVLVIVFLALILLSTKGLSFTPDGLSMPLGITQSSVSHEVAQEAATHEASAAPTVRKANATFIILCRNSELDGIIQSVREVEDRFNRDFNYPYVFLNDEPFTEEFKRRLSVLSPSLMEFGVIPHDHWFQPSWINEETASAARKLMEMSNVIYGGSVSYRNMCRFNSGFFFRHPLVQKYRPNVHFHCNIPSDPFLYMEDNNKTYGFTISMYEFESTIRSLWQTVREYTSLHPEHVHPNNSMGFLSQDNGKHYNLCHFWSNFEIADMDFWRSETYMMFFEFLDSTGGFYYERWGDAPVHSIAASLFLPKDAIHFFDEIGYQHTPFTHCPRDIERWINGRCSCDPGQSFDYSGYSCLRQWEAVAGRR